MNSRRVDDVWRLLVVAVVEVLNPLLLISLALFVSVGYILTLLTPVNVDIWASLLILSLLIPAIPLILRAVRIWRNEAYASDRVTWRVLLPLSPLLALAPVALIQLAYPSLHAIAHEDIYFSYVIQAFHGSTPLENAFLPGYPVNHYWLYHTMIAAIVKLTSVDTFTVVSVLNFAFLLGGLLWLSQTILALSLAKPRTLLLGILVMFVFGAVNATGSLSILPHIFSGSFEPGERSLFLLPGADRRLYSIFPKLYNASGMTPGVAAFTALLFACVRMIRQRVEMSSLVLISASGIVALGVMPIVVPFLVCVLLGGLALTTISMWRKSARRIGAAVDFVRLNAASLNPLSLLLWLSVSLILSLPLLRYIDEFTSNYQSGVSIGLPDPTNVAMTLAASILLLPIAGVYIALSFRHTNKIDRFMSFSGVLGILLALSITMPDQNQYKFQYPLAMLLALSSLLGAAQWERRGKTKWTAILRVYVAFLVGLALLSSVFGLHFFAYRVIQFYGQGRHDGIHVLSTHDLDGRRSAYYWIRDNTPLEAIVVLPREYTKESPLFHERLNYVKEKQSYYVDNIPAYDLRVNELRAFYDPFTPLPKYERLLESMKSQLPERPFYAVVKYTEISPAQMIERGAQQVFDSPLDMVAVYLLNPI